jgi:hypothetical protein
MAVHGAMLFAKSADGAGIIVPRAPQAKATEEDGEDEVDAEKPYPNEHACRLLDPDQFARFARETREHEGKEYDVIFGYRSDGSSDQQAFRYKKSTWEADEARSHCESHDGSFEAASGESTEDEADEGKAISVIAEIDEAAVAKAIAEMKIGRVLSRKNEDKIRQANSALTEVLASLDKEKPTEEEPAADAIAAAESKAAEGEGESPPAPDPADTEPTTSAERLSQLIAERVADIIAASTTVHRPLHER